MTPPLVLARKSVPADGLRMLSLARLAGTQVRQECCSSSRLVNVACIVAENEGPCYQQRHGGAAVVNLYTPLVTCDKIKQIAAHYSYTTRIGNSSVL